MTVPPLYSLAEAAARFFPGSLTKRSLRTEIAKGRLQAVKIAGKHLVTEAAVAALINVAVCEATNAAPKAPAVAIGGRALAVPDGNRALSAALATIEQLKQRKRPDAHASSGSRRQP
jgi:hypothetical protein